ncbi:ABC transporter permease [Streptomyces sp. NPDC056821]|uniref:ABC transporter permease n=1 Tax=unclassified Streptomyces TaxID=2593676 RepID=UPI00367D94D6
MTVIPASPEPAMAGGRVRAVSARFHRRDLGIIGATAFLVGLCAIALLAHFPNSPTTPDVSAIALPPSGAHPFGTDISGFDVFARTIDAAARDVPIAVTGSLLSLLIGVPIGLFATTGRLGEACMRVIDAFSALPMIVLAIVAIQLLGGGAFDIVAAIAVVNVPRFCRLTRAEAISLRSARFVEAAVAIGCSPVRIAFNHVFRNAYGVVLVQATLAGANAIGVIAALNFLGVGVHPPQPTWGSMIHDGSAMLIQGQWWAAVFPTVAIFLVVCAFTVIADGVEGRVERTGGKA